MDGVGTPIIGRPRPLPGHDTPNPAYHPHTLNYEEPVKANINTDLIANIIFGERNGHSSLWHVTGVMGGKKLPEPFENKSKKSRWSIPKAANESTSC